MIYGIGNDVITLSRIESIVQGRLGDRFLRRILTEDELQLYENRQANRYEFVAGRFAAKEAIAKAFGCGIGAMLSFQDIDIMPDSNGRPTCKLSDKCIQRLSERLSLTQPMHVHISISHCDTIASAFAVVETR